MLPYRFRPLAGICAAIIARYAFDEHPSQTTIKVVTELRHSS
ncbi:hypothetical protein [Prevotella falsenii]|nr:hypothetical protein [Prevotella falsenii]